MEVKGISVSQSVLHFFMQQPTQNGFLRYANIHGKIRNSALVIPLVILWLT